jgi:type 1 glutamine amidotransferase
MRFTPSMFQTKLIRAALASLLALVAFGSTAAELFAVEKTKIVFVAGRRSHGYGSHEHKAGCMLLAKALNDNVPNINAVVLTEGWPKDPKALDGAKAVVMYGDGGGRHMVNRHLKQLDELSKKGVGVACFHYAVEVPKGASGKAFLDWIGGYFETHWSVNPHWTAEFKAFPKHPISQGVGPFAVNDEWYFHMRFREGMKGVTPILSAKAPASTMRRRNGPHSGNEAVRKAVAAGTPQHVAWASETEGRGRGFGFTGGHNHWNWGSDDFRKTALNAIVWVAGLEVPKGGVPSKTPTVADLQANQDYNAPKNFKGENIQKKIDAWNKK